MMQIQAIAVATLSIMKCLSNSQIKYSNQQIHRCKFAKLVDKLSIFFPKTDAFQQPSDAVLRAYQLM